MAMCDTVRGGENWNPMIIAELKVFIEIQFLLSLKKQPRKKRYCRTNGSIFHPSLITKLMSKDQFMALNRCFHVTNKSTYVRDRNAHGYDKMGQIRWLVNEVGYNFRKYCDLWNFLHLPK